MPDPVVSIVMATFNGAAHLGETLESLAAQSFRDWELILVDDASADDTVRIAASFDDPRVTILAQERNRGPAAARNIGFALARGRYVAGLDQDDLCRSDRLARQVAFLDRHRDVVLVATANSSLSGGRRCYRPHLRRSSPAALDWLLHVRNPLTWSSVMFRQGAMRRLDPPTRPEHMFAEDYDFYHRLRAFGRIARIDRDLLVYRDHAAGASKRHRDRMLDAATGVLAERYRGIFAEDAAHRARTILRHVGLCEPATELGVLVEIGGTITQVRDHLLGSAAAMERDVIEREAACTWWEVVAHARAAGLRSFPVTPAGITMRHRSAAHLVKAECRRAIKLFTGAR